MSHISSNLILFLACFVFHNIDIFLRVQVSYFAECPSIWVCLIVSLWLDSSQTFFGEILHKWGCVLSVDTWGCMMSVCPITGNVKLGHLVMVIQDFSSVWITFPLHDTLRLCKYLYIDLHVFYICKTFTQWFSKSIHFHNIFSYKKLRKFGKTCCWWSVRYWVGNRDT